MQLRVLPAKAVILVVQLGDEEAERVGAAMPRSSALWHQDGRGGGCSQHNSIGSAVTGDALKVEHHSPRIELGEDLDKVSLSGIAVAISSS